MAHGFKTGDRQVGTPNKNRAARKAGVQLPRLRPADSVSRNRFRSAKYIKYLLFA